MTRSPASGLKKLGHPQCESNFALLRNSSRYSAAPIHPDLLVVGVFAGEGPLGAGAPEPAYSSGDSRPAIAIGFVAVGLRHATDGTMERLLRDMPPPGQLVQGTACIGQPKMPLTTEG